MTSLASPQRVFKSMLIYGASVCLFAFAPAAFAQRAGSRGGGGARGGSSGAAHAGTSHPGGGFHGGSSFHSGGPYGGSGISVHPAHVGGILPTPPARMSSGGSSRGFQRFGSGSRADFTGSSFVAPPRATGHVEGSARTIFINGNSERMSAPVNARPFAAGNYLWEAPPQRGTGRVVPPPPAAPHPVAMPAPAPIRPMVMQPPSPMRPIGFPAPMRVQNPRPVAMPVMPSPVSGRMGGRFVAPPMGGVHPVAPAPPLFHPIRLMGHPHPVPPVFGGMAIDPGLKPKPSVSFTAFGASNPTSAHPCIDTFTQCGIYNGGFDGDGDFDDGGFGFAGQFGFSPLGFGSNCFFGGWFQDCFLSSSGFGGFGFDSFGFGGGWNSWGYWPYTSSALYQPLVENLPPYLPEELGGNQPRTNYAPAYIYVPEPLTRQQPPPSTNANTSSANQPIVDLVLKDGTVFGVTTYWLSNGRLCYITTYQIQSSIPMRQLDLQKTVDMNWKRGIAFTLTPQAPEQEPQQNPQPQTQE